MFNRCSISKTIHIMYNTMNYNSIQNNYKIQRRIHCILANTFSSQSIHNGMHHNNIDHTLQRNHSQISNNHSSNSNHANNKVQSSIASSNTTSNNDTNLFNRTFTNNSSKAGSNAELPLAAMCVIGNEVLSGKIVDTNTPFLAKLLFKRGIELIRIATIPDIIDDIAATISDLSKRVGPNGFVFTSGGIGPTHDDVTYEGIAKAFNLPLEYHEPTLKLLTQFTAKRNQQLNTARKRMALIPKGSTVLTTPKLWVPLVKTNNVYILPGVPKLFELMISNMDTTGAFNHGKPLHRLELQINKGEGDIADLLTQQQSQYPDVRIGSYPNTMLYNRLDRNKETAASNNNSTTEHITHTVSLVFEGRDVDTVTQVAKTIQESTGGILIVHSL